MVPKKIKASEGETKGISTLLKAYSDKKGLFKCILCGKEEERGVCTHGFIMTGLKRVHV